MIQVKASCRSLLKRIERLSLLGLSFRDQKASFELSLNFEVFVLFFRPLDKGAFLVSLSCFFGKHSV